MVISISIAFVLYYNQKKAIYYAEHSLLYKYCIDNYNANNYRIFDMLLNIFY